MLHSSFFSNYFGGHGIAIDSTDPDHFIATDCVAGTGNGDTIVLPSGEIFTFNSTTRPPGYLNGGASGFGGGGGSGEPEGNGGQFGGHGDIGNGGGGAGLGGAIFNDSGTINIYNSTFYNNSATQGLASMANCFCASPATNGDGAGGAIFSRNGSLKLVDVTISGNHSSTSGAGLEVFGDSTASFVIQNTIVANNTITANNGATAECVLAGSTVNRSGAGNLIINNGSG
jgi:hypothetical protein